MYSNRLLRWLSGIESACQCGRYEIHPWVRKIPWRRKWQPIPVLLPGKFHGQRSWVGYSPRGRKESDMTEHTHNVFMPTATIWMGETKLRKMNWEEKMLPNMRRNHVIFFFPYSLALLKTTSIWGECFRVNQSKHHHFLYKSQLHSTLKYWDARGGRELGEEKKMWSKSRGEAGGEGRGRGRLPSGEDRAPRTFSKRTLILKLAHHQRLTKEEYDFSVWKDSGEMSGNFVSNCCSCCSVHRSCLTICEPMDNSTPAPLSSTVSGSLLRFTFPELVMLE